MLALKNMHVMPAISQYGAEIHNRGLVGLVSTVALPPMQHKMTQTNLVISVRFWHAIPYSSHTRGTCRINIACVPGADVADTLCKFIRARISDAMSFVTTTSARLSPPLASHPEQPDGCVDVKPSTLGPGHVICRRQADGSTASGQKVSAVSTLECTLGEHTTKSKGNRTKRHLHRRSHQVLQGVTVF